MEKKCVLNLVLCSVMFFFSSFSQASSLKYATHLGGATDADGAFGLASDSLGNMYIASNSYSTDFPVTSGAYRIIGTTGNLGVAVTKISPAGQIVWSAFMMSYDNNLGNHLSLKGSPISVNQNGEVYVAARARGTGFPVTTNAYQSVSGGGGDDVYLFKLSADGSSLLYGSYFGGVGIESATAVNVASSGEVVVAGITYSTNFPVTSGAFQTVGDTVGASFVIKLDATDQVVYSTYLGGANTSVYDAILNSAGQALVVGSTQSGSFPTTSGALYPTARGPANGIDGFVTRLNSTGTGLVFSTYLGGALDDYIYSVKENSNGIYLGTDSTSADFPITAGGTPCVAGFDGAVLTHLSLDGGTLLNSNCFVGRDASNNPVYVYQGSLEVDASGKAWLAGTADETLYQGLFNPAQSLYTPVHTAPSQVAYLFQVDSNGLTVPFGTFLDGAYSSADGGGIKYLGITGLKLDNAGNLWASAYEGGATLSTTSNAIQTTAPRGGEDGYILEITAPVSPAPSGSGGGVFSLFLLLPLLAISLIRGSLKKNKQESF